MECANLLADDTPEFEIVGDLYPYFTIGTDGLTLRLEVEAPRLVGGGPLTGFVEMPLPYDSEANVPLLAQGAIVNNAAYQDVPLAPNDVFAAFAFIPGLPAKGSTPPFPKALGGVQVLIDGSPSAPLIYVDSGLVQGCNGPQNLDSRLIIS